MALYETAVKHTPGYIQASDRDCIQDPAIGISSHYLQTKWPPLKRKKERDWKEVKKKVLTGRKKETGKKETGRNKGSWKFERPSD